MFYLKNSGNLLKYINEVNKELRCSADKSWNNMFLVMTNGPLLILLVEKLIKDLLINLKDVMTQLIKQAFIN